jgi:hypothetical protein
MLRSPWLRNVWDMARSRYDRHRRAARSRKSVYLMLESLEKRLTPSGPQTAASYADLVNAVAVDTAANTNYVIDITNNFTFNSGGQVTISKLGIGSALTIEGQNGTNYTLMGNGNRLFTVASDQNVTFADLTLTGGAVTNSNGPAQGGAIEDVGGNVTLSDVSIQDDTVTGSLAEGGGLYVSGGGNLTIKNGSMIQSDNAIATSFAAGGGVYVVGDSTVAISDSILSKNSATGGQGANGTGPGANGSDGGTAYGGGLDVNGSGWTVTLTGDTLSGNILLGGNGGNGAAVQNATGTNASGGNGGNGGQGGFATGGGAYFFVSKDGTGHLTILNDPTANHSEFLDNSIQSGAGGNGGDGGTSTGTANNANGGDGGMANQAVGGALFISSAAGGTVTATIGNTTFSGNKVFGAKGGAGGAAGAGGSGSTGVTGTNPGGSFAEGGGIALENSVTATINDSTVVNNTAAASSGVNDVARGGGIANFGGTLTLSQVTVRSNTGTGAAAQGGGIYDSSGGNLTVQGGSVIQSNNANGSGYAQGGGVYVSGASTVTIADSTLRSNRVQGENGADGTAAGQNGGIGGTAQGGGLLIRGDNWVVTLRGDTLSGNSALGGNGGNGAAGSNATAPNTSGGYGGNGGDAGAAAGGAAYFLEIGDSSGNGSSTLKILNDPVLPTTDPSTMIGNSAQGGAAGNGGAGGTSTGTANNANGGNAGFLGYASGGAIAITSTQGSRINATIGNTTFYGNTASLAKGATGGAAGTGGSGTAGKPGTNHNGTSAIGGGLYVEGSYFVMVNSTVAKNTANGGAWGGGIAFIGDATATLENNTITQNTIDGGFNWGSGLFAEVSDPSLFTLLNNLIQGNQSIGSPAADLNANFENATTLSSAANNFIGSAGANIATNATNIIGNSQPQLGGVIGVSANDNPSGGPIYYPLLSGSVSIGAGSTSVLPTVASVEGTTSANTTDEIRNPRSRNGSIDLGAVQFVSLSPPPSPAPSPSPPAPPALNVPPLLVLLDSLLGGTETVNADGTETITDSLFGIPLIVSAFDSHGDLVSVALFGFNITFLFV